MKEHEYILVQNLTSIQNSIDCLKSVIPENSSIITKEEYTSVMSILWNWKEAHHSKITIKD